MIERIVALVVIPWCVASVTGWAFWVGVHTLLSTGAPDLIGGMS